MGNPSLIHLPTIPTLSNTIVVNSEPKDWFKGGDLAYDAIILILIMAFQFPVLVGSNYWGRYKQYKVNFLVPEDVGRISTYY